MDLFSPEVVTLTLDMIIVSDSWGIVGFGRRGGGRRKSCSSIEKLTRRTEIDMEAQLKNANKLCYCICVDRLLWESC